MTFPTLGHQSLEDSTASPTFEGEFSETQAMITVLFELSFIESVFYINRLYSFFMTKLVLIRQK